MLRHHTRQRLAITDVLKVSCDPEIVQTVMSRVFRSLVGKSGPAGVQLHFDDPIEIVTIHYISYTSWAKSKALYFYRALLFEPDL